MKKPDYFIVGAAFVSFLFSITLWFGIFGDDQGFNRQAALFVGLWVPSILAFGNYFKRVNEGG